MRMIIIIIIYIRLQMHTHDYLKDYNEQKPITLSPKGK